ncbi:MAG TPA: nitroreductase family protein, partial [Armatimonadota bacterium]|nr:nitroreductase family protein [Armatimonadota bacterium]
MLDFVVDEARCTRCGLCAQDCVVRIIELKDGACPSIIEEEASDCLRCQHCLAICPVGAISILGRKPEDSLPLAPEHLPELEAMERLVRGRRSVRHYRDENVDPALLERLFTALANAPTGANRQELTFRVIDDRGTMARFRNKAMGELREAIEAAETPEQLGGVRRFVQAYYEEDRDLVFRGAPHVLIVSAPPDSPCPQEDVVLALAYFELLA